METQRLEISRTEARELYRKYKEHLVYSKPIDDEIRRTYQLMAQGRVIIRALESIKAAGLDERGMPKLAICLATSEECLLRMDRDGSARMSANAQQHRQSSWRRPLTANRSRFMFPAGTFEVKKDIWNARALVPMVPIHLRPKRGLANYHVLWEAEWTRVVPQDPMLLRRVSKGDIWLVVAAWDLTEVERAALQARIK